MLIDLLSTGNYASFNIKLAHIIGLEASIYINELLNINEKAIRKSKLHGNLIKLDREYITKRTTLSADKQLEIEQRLIKIGLITKDESNSNLLSIDISILTSLVMSDDEDLLKSVEKLTRLKGAKKTSAKEAAIEKLKDYVIATDPELREAYFSWINTIYAKQGWMSAKAVTAAQSIVDSFADHDLDLALKIIDIADTNGYRDMEWAVNKYKENYKVHYQLKPVQLNIDNNPNALGDDIF